MFLYSQSENNCLYLKRLVTWLFYWLLNLAEEYNRVDFLDLMFFKSDKQKGLMKSIVNYSFLGKKNDSERQFTVGELK